MKHKRVFFIVLLEGVFFCDVLGVEVMGKIGGCEG